MATNDEILHASAKNASYIVQLETENERLKLKIDALKAIRMVELHNGEFLSDEEYVKKFERFMAWGAC